MVFLTEMGDLSRFSNRKQIGAYLGLVPASNESGEGQERKGHITRQGSPRVRKMLCQATWSRVRTDKNEQLVYGRICAKNPKSLSQKPDLLRPAAKPDGCVVGTKRPRRGSSHASGPFAPAALPSGFSLALATNGFLG